MATLSSTDQFTGEAVPDGTASLTDQAVSSLLKMVPRLGRLMKHQVGHGQLTPQQIHLLLAVCDLSGRGGEGARPGELSRRCWLSNPAITAAVDDLVEQGLAVRAHSEKDRRTVLVRLTPAGEQVLREGRMAATAALAPLLHGWDEDRLLVFTQMLRDLDRAAEAMLDATHA